MPTVVWTLGANTVTFAKGILAGASHRQVGSRAVSDRTAGGQIVSYDLGVTPLEVIGYEFPSVSQTIRDAAFNFKDTLVKDDLLTFTHTDNSKSPAFVKTVRLVGLEQVDVFHGDPSIPRYTLRATLQVEPV